MRINKFLLTSMIFFMSGSAHAADFFWSGALSGGGKAMGEWASQMQALEAQRALMEQQYRLEREREERAYQRQRERELEERTYQQQWERELGSSQGKYCVTSNAMIGARVEIPNMKVKKVTALYGASPKCSDPTFPILANLEEVSDSQGSYCVSSDTTGGMLIRMPNGKMGKITTFYGESAQCSDPATPILVDMKEVKF